MSVELNFRTVNELVEFTAKSLLLSQHYTVFTEADELLALTGVGTGKTTAIAMRATLLSHFTPDNYGLVGRSQKTELMTTTKKVFDEVLPPEIDLGFIGEPHSMRKVASVDPKRPSYMAFKHLTPSKPGKTHLSSMNLGWVAVDQLEDVSESEWDYVATRLRRANCPIASFGAANPKGRDWLYRRYIEPALKGGKYEKRAVPGKLGRQTDVEFWSFEKEIRREERERRGKIKDYTAKIVTIRASSEENIHLPDGFLERILATRSQEYIQRYVYASFDDWGGKIYKELRHDSVHVIDSFEIPSDWKTVVMIDVGGDDPWALITARIDPVSNDVFIVAELYGQLRLDEVVAWIGDSERSFIPDPRNARIGVDPENKPVLRYIQQYYPLVEAARKGPIVPGILQVADYLHCRPGRFKVIPKQRKPGSAPQDQVIENAPRMWFFRDRAPTCIRQLDEYQWDRDRRTGLSTNKPLGINDHFADCARYLCRIMPPVEQLRDLDIELETLRMQDIHSYHAELSRMDAMGERRRKGAGLDELYCESIEDFSSKYKQSDNPFLI